MKLTKEEKLFVKNEKKSIIKSWRSMMLGVPRFDGDGFFHNGYKKWASWKMVQIIERLSK